MTGLDGTLDERGRVCRHMGSWCRTFVPGEVGTVGLALALVTRRASQTGKIRLISYHGVRHDRMNMARIDGVFIMFRVWEPEEEVRVSI